LGQVQPPALLDEKRFKLDPSCLAIRKGQAKMHAGLEIIVEAGERGRQRRRGRSILMLLATRLILEELLEGEVRDGGNVSSGGGPRSGP
jgi:hypothetical protein